MSSHELLAIQEPERRANQALTQEEPHDVTAREIKLHERFLDTAMSIIACVRDGERSHVCKPCATRGSAGWVSVHASAVVLKRPSSSFLTRLNTCRTLVYVVVGTSYLFIVRPLTLHI